MKSVKQMVKGIGTVINRTYDRKTMAEKALKQMRELSPALEFISSPGWKTVMGEYANLVTGIHDHIVFLSQNAKKNETEIQRNSDFLGALQVVIQTTDEIVNKYSEAHKIHEENKTEPVKKAS